MILLPAAHAHVVSISTGELRVNGTEAEYELRIPAYEIVHVTDPEQALLDQVVFAGATPTAASCEIDPADDMFVCREQLTFVAPIPDKLDVHSALFEVTVPNHVHLLYAVQGGNSDQVVLDQTTPDAEIRFRPPSMLETLERDGSAGIGRLLASVSGLLFLGALALAARSRHEAMILGGGFIVAQWVARPIALLIPVALSEAFLESAMALTVAYLAAELLFLTDSNSRWAIVPLLGIVHGFAFAAFPLGYLAGASVAQAVLIAVLVFIALGLTMQARRFATMAILTVGIAWFGTLLLL